MIKRAFPFELNGGAPVVLTHLTYYFRSSSILHPSIGYLSPILEPPVQERSDLDEYMDIGEKLLRSALRRNVETVSALNSSPGRNEYLIWLHSEVDRRNRIALFYKEFHDLDA